MRKISRRTFLKGSIYSTAALSSPFLLKKASLSALEEKEGHNWEDWHRSHLEGEKIVRTVDLPNCTGACAWNVVVKDGVAIRADQPNDYPDDQYNPRGCMKGRTYYKRVYGPDRVKFPMKRVGERGSGLWKRISWDEAFDFIASEIKRISQKYGSKTVWIYPPVPATGLVKQGAGFRFASANSFGIGTFYNWYGDLPLAHPITWNVQTEEHEFLDLINTKYAIIWGSDMLETRLPDAHFFTDAQVRGVKVVYISPYYDSTAAMADEWIRPRPGADAALAMGFCHVMLKKGLVKGDYVKKTTCGPLLVRKDNGKYLKEADLVSGGSTKNFIVWDMAIKGPKVDEYYSDTAALEGTYSILVLYHTSFRVWNYTNLAFFAFWLMVFLLINGIIGSYIYTQRLRGVETKELTMKEIKEMSKFISDVLKQRGREDINLHEVSMSFYKGGKGFGNFKVLGIAAFNDLFIIPLKIWGLKKMLRRDLGLPSYQLAYIAELVKRDILFRRRTDQFDANQKLYERWGGVHRVFSLAFLFVMVIHSVAGYLFAIK